MERLSEESKVDVALVGQTINNTNATGRYFSMSNYRRGRFVLVGGAAAATKTVKLEVLQATSSAGAGAKAVTSASATATANTLATSVTIALASVANTDVVTINGLAFTKAAATDASAREFADAAGLVTCVNSSAYGVANVLASASGTDVTLVPVSGEAAITVAKTENAGTITLATAEALVYVEFETTDLDLANGFSYVAAKVTSTGNGIDCVLLDRYGGKYNAPTQKVAASATI